MNQGTDEVSVRIFNKALKTGTDWLIDSFMAP